MTFHILLPHAILNSNIPSFKSEFPIAKFQTYLLLSHLADLLPVNTMKCFTLLTPFKSSPYYTFVDFEAITPYGKTLITLLPICNSDVFYPD